MMIRWSSSTTRCWCCYWCYYHLCCWILISALVLVLASVAAHDNSNDRHDILYQDRDGHLCNGKSDADHNPDFENGGECWDSNDQFDILNNQLWYFENDLKLTCRDLLLEEKICKSQIRNASHDCFYSDKAVYFQSYCPRTCKVCHNRTRIVKKSIEKKPRRVSEGKVVYDAIGSDIGVPQIVKGSNQDQIRQIVMEAQDYVRNTIDIDDRYFTVRDKCRNAHPNCAEWASEGQCASNIDYMWNKCAPVCRTCDELHYTARCPIDQNQKHAWYPGDLNKMFERVVSDPYYNKVYNITVLSRPDYVNDDDKTKDTTATSHTNIGGPWMIVIDNFTKPEEAKKLIEIGGRVGYERSEDAGDGGDDGEVGGIVSSGRTSENAWCDPEPCESQPLVRDVIDRMTNLTNIHWNYSELIQLLRYDVGQYYSEHHDYTDSDYRRMVGSRILTVYLYLNDVEKGGGTHFGRMNVTVTPKLGRAVLWPSVLDDDPHSRDNRTNHQALPVEKGIKYGANVWYHQRQYRVAFEKGC